MKKVVIKDVGALQNLLGLMLTYGTFNNVDVNSMRVNFQTAFTEEEEQPWKPVHGEKGYQLETYGEIVEDQWIENSSWREGALKFGFYFKTKEEAEARLLWLKEQLKNKK